MKQSVFLPAPILLPAFHADAEKMAKWSVIACDQYTSAPDYWEKVENTVGDAPSALRITLPEIFLNKPGVDERISGINRTMETYLDAVLEAQKPSYIYVERMVLNGKRRRGIVGMLDLETYDYTKGSHTPVRATEGTVLSRIPPRVKIRENAPLETPHVMVLADDPENTIWKAAEEDAKSFGTAAYAFDLMQNGGHIAGWQLSEQGNEAVGAAIDALIENAPKDSAGMPMVFAVGDGNHSLATAKACWEKVKETLGAEAAASHPARYALIELVNIHDEALAFEPIYRVVFHVKAEELLAEMKAFYPALREYPEGGSIESTADEHIFGVICGAEMKKLGVPSPKEALPVGTLQVFLDDYLSRHPECEVDYIHGTAETVNFGSQPDTIAFLFSGMAKSQLFPAVIQGGALPRKTFSMGEADEKRFYLECRKIR